MHTCIFKNKTFEGLNDEINNFLEELYSVTRRERNYSEVKDIKITSKENEYLALIILDQDYK